MPSVKTLIFDFDGTLADNFELAVDIAHGLLDLPPMDEQEVNRLRHLPLLKVIRELKIPLYRVPRLLLTGHQMMHERTEEVRPFPGLVKTLQELHAAGHPMLIMSSNSEQNVRTFLRAHDIEQYFEGVYSGIGLFNKAAALKKVLRRNGLRAEDCLYIGDEVRDILAAAKVHMRTISVTWGYQAAQALADHHPFAIARTPADLLHIIGQ